MEAMTHISRSNSSENIEQAQRALASTRSSQWDPLTQNLPQLLAMTHFVDICCSLHQTDTKQAQSKMKTTQASLDTLANDPRWSDDGTFGIPISNETKRTLTGLGSAEGVVRPGVDGHLTLQVNWLPKDDIYALGYLLSAVVSSNRNAMDGQKAEAYIKQAGRILSCEPSRSYEGTAANANSASQCTTWINGGFGGLGRMAANTTLPCRNRANIYSMFADSMEFCTERAFRAQGLGKRPA
jgi:hypothetical protein